VARQAEPGDESGLVTTAQGNATVANGDHCTVIAGTHKGKSGVAEDWQLSKSGHATNTARQADGARCKVLPRNVARKA
jgi:hypothetical protein